MCRSCASGYAAIKATRVRRRKQHFDLLDRCRALNTEVGLLRPVFHCEMPCAGHGGDQFIKFQDREEMSAQDLADAVHQMHLQQRYRAMLIIADTCQAGTLSSRMSSPNVIAIGSSKLGENSYSVCVASPYMLRVLMRWLLPDVYLCSLPIHSITLTLKLV